MKKLFRIFSIIIVTVSLCASIFLIAEPFMQSDTTGNIDRLSAADNDDVVTLTVTATGDVTLATDASAASSISFVSEVKKTDYDYSHFLSKVKPYLDNDDLTIVNFEGTLSNRGERASKQFAFRGDPEYVKILTSSSVEAANLANNHTRDYGANALNDTKEILSENGITWFLGKDTAIYEVNGINVGLIGFSALSGDSTAEFLKILDSLKESEPDMIIASFHWGQELAHTPNARQIQFAHTAIDNGVDLVLGHHPHVLQGIEKYNGKYIVYSLGNFCFGGNKNPTDKDTMIFKQTFVFEENELINNDIVTVIPCSISSEKGRNNYQPVALQGEEFERVKNKIMTRSADFTGVENITFTEG